MLGGGCCAEWEAGLWPSKPSSSDNSIEAYGSKNVTRNGLLPAIAVCNACPAENEADGRVKPRECCLNDALNSSS